MILFLLVGLPILVTVFLTSIFALEERLNNENR
jgi:hypothetical protein